MIDRAGDALRDALENARRADVAQGRCLTARRSGERLGYQSEAAFSRAFKRFMRVSPGSVRRNGTSAGPKAASLNLH